MELDRAEYLGKEKEPLVEEGKALEKELEVLQEEYDKYPLWPSIVQIAGGGVAAALSLFLSFYFIFLFGMWFLIIIILVFGLGVFYVIWGVLKLSKVKEKRRPLAEKINERKRKIKFINQSLLLTAQNKSLSKALNEQPKEPREEPSKEKIDPEQELVKLKDLFEKGLITEEEYSKAKKKILGI